MTPERYGLKVQKPTLSSPSDGSIERYVELVEHYPFMQRGGWLRTHVLDAGDVLEKIPAAARAVVAALLDQDAIGAKRAIECLQNVAAMSAARRAELVRLAQSADAFERGIALTMAGDVPSPPDPGLLHLAESARVLARAATQCRSTRFKAPVSALAASASELLAAFRADEKRSRAAEEERVDG